MVNNSNITNIINKLSNSLYNYNYGYYTKTSDTIDCYKTQYSDQEVEYWDTILSNEGEPHNKKLKLCKRFSNLVITVSEYYVLQIKAELKRHGLLVSILVER